MKLTTVFCTGVVLGGAALINAAAWAQSTDIGAAVATRIMNDVWGGCIAAVRIQREEQHWTRQEAFNCAEAHHERPTADSVFEVGSISKAMLGTLAAMMAEQGELDIDAPLSYYLSDVEVPTYEGEPIRLQHLLTHTSGLPRLPARLDPADTDDPYVDFSRDALLASLSEATLSHKPGDTFAYSNFAYMLLSEVLVKHSEKPLDELFASFLFEPLNMQASGFEKATVQGRSADGSAVPNWGFPINMGGVGGIRSSLNDMVKFAKLQLGDGPAAQVAGAQKSHQVLAQTEQLTMGWGWMHYQHNDRHYVMHGGGTGGFNAMIIVDPDSQSASVVLANAALHATGDVQQLGLHLLDNSVDPGQAYQRVAQPDDIKLDDYFGSYELMPGFAVRVFAEDDVLMIQGTGQPAAAVTYKEQDTFENVQYGAVFEFERDDTGQVRSLVLRQFGQQLRGDRQADES